MSRILPRAVSGSLLGVLSNSDGRASVGSELRALSGSELHTSGFEPGALSARPDDAA